MHVCTPHTGLIDALWCTGAVCDGQPAGGWVYLPPALSLSLSLCILTFSHVLRAAVHCCGTARANILSLAQRKWVDCIKPADVFDIPHRLAGLTHFTSSLQLEVTCGREGLSVSASGKVALQHCPLTVLIVLPQ